MRLTRGADYGARGILYLAKLPPASVVLVGEIAAAEGLPESYMAKIFQDLAKEGIVRSHRGARGGFSLARPAEQITLRQVIEAIEGPIALNRCLNPWEGCDKCDTCALRPVLASAQEQMLAILDATDIGTLAQQDEAAQAG
ncbi:MAG: RrF2 family transcriptional regulator [Anaerolineae bacterium]